MERLTELKVGTYLSEKLLNAWGKEGKNLGERGDMSAYSSENFALNKGDRPVVEVFKDKFKTGRADSGAGYVFYMVLEGFVEFYNQFYKLDTQPITKQDLGNSKIWIGDNPELFVRVYNKLIELGCTKNDIVIRSKYKSIYVYSNLTLAHSNDREYFDRTTTSFNRIFTPEELLGTNKSQTKQTARTKIDWANLKDVEFNLPNKESQDKFLNKLFDLGYTLNDETDLWDDHLNYWRINRNKSISGGAGSVGHTLLDYKQLINTNNTPLNNKTDGKSIIVRNPYPTVSRGQRPEGRSTLGKTSRVTVTVGHLRNRAINSEC